MSHIRLCRRTHHNCPLSQSHNTFLTATAPTGSTRHSHPPQRPSRHTHHTHPVSRSSNAHLQTTPRPHHNTHPSHCQCCLYNTSPRCPQCHYTAVTPLPAPNSLTNRSCPPSPPRIHTHQMLCHTCCAPIAKSDTRCHWSSRTRCHYHTHWMQQA